MDKAYCRDSNCTGWTGNWDRDWTDNSDTDSGKTALTGSDRKVSMELDTKVSMGLDTKVLRVVGKREWVAVDTKVGHRRRW